MSQHVWHLLDGEVEELTNKRRHGALLDDQGAHVALGHRVVLQYRHQRLFFDRAYHQVRWKLCDGCPGHRKVQQVQVVIAGK